MNLAFFPQPDRGVELRGGWATPSAGALENMEAQWDGAWTPDNMWVYDSRAAEFYDDALAKMKASGLGDYPNPFREVNNYDLALRGEGQQDMVNAVRAVGPADYKPGDFFDPFPLRDAWRARLDQILIEARKTHPDIPDPTTFDKAMAAESAATRARADDIASRATFMGKLGGFAGGTAGAMLQPDQLLMTAATLPLGGGVALALGRTLISRLLAAAATDAVLGAAQTAASELAEAEFQQQHFGYSKSGNEILLDTAYAAAGNALFGLGANVAGEVGGRLLSVGLRSAVDQSQALYPVLPKIGRDAADVLDSELQLTTTGPANNLAAHAENVARATEAVVRGETPSPPITAAPLEDGWTAPDGRKLTTELEVVELNELKPGSALRQEIHGGIDALIARLKALPDEELARFVIKGTKRPDGKRKSGKSIESFLGQGVHKIFSGYVDRKPGWKNVRKLKGEVTGAGQEPDAVHLSKRLAIELKPNSPSGKALGKRQAARYRTELNKKVRTLKWTITKAQKLEIIQLKKRIFELQQRPEYPAWAAPRSKPKPKRERKPKPK